MKRTFMDKKQSIENVLFKPSAQYFADTYTTLISVVQGLALAAFFLMMGRVFIQYTNSHNAIDFESLKTFLKFLNCFLMISLIWHRYATGNQFYSWPLGPVDAVIPFGFSVLQALLILSISHENYYFGFFASCLTLLGVFAYANTMYRHDNAKVKKHYEEHYDTFTKGLGEFLYFEIKKYEKRAQLHLLALTAYLFGFAILAWTHPSYDGISGWFLTAPTALALLYELFILDFKRQLRKSGRFQEYPW